MRIQLPYNQLFTDPYSFQAQEHDDEVKGDGNSVNFEFRMHDPRLGRFFAIDPLIKSYPHYTPYSFSGNKVIAFKEFEGLEEASTVKDEVTPELKVASFKDILIESMTKAGIVMTYGFPSVSNNSKLKPNGKYAFDKIEINYDFNRAFTSGITTDGDWISVIRHEYEHYVDEKSGRYPLKFNSDGTVMNQHKVLEEKRFSYSDEERKALSLVYQLELSELENELGKEKAIKLLGPEDIIPSETVFSSWEYHPSNLESTELNAYKSQLEGEKQGLYELSNSFRTVVEARIKHFERKVEWSKQYEKENNLNSDGSARE